MKTRVYSTGEREVFAVKKNGETVGYMLYLTRHVETSFIETFGIILSEAANKFIQDGEKDEL